MEEHRLYRRRVSRQRLQKGHEASHLGFNGQIDRERKHVIVLGRFEPQPRYFANLLYSLGVNQIALNHEPKDMQRSRTPLDRYIVGMAGRGTRKGRHGRVPRLLQHAGQRKFAEVGKGHSRSNARVHHFD